MNHRPDWLTIAGAMLLTVPALAQSERDVLKTDWMKQTKGYQDESVGAEVREIEVGGAESGRKLTVAIPKSAIDDPEMIEEVVVVGKKPKEPEPLLRARFEWLDDYDAENYGLVIHLGKESTWPLRLYMSAEHGFLHQDATRLME